MKNKISKNYIEILKNFLELLTLLSPIIIFVPIFYSVENFDWAYLTFCLILFYIPLSIYSAQKVISVYNEKRNNNIKLNNKNLMINGMLLALLDATFIVMVKCDYIASIVAGVLASFLIHLNIIKSMFNKRNVRNYIDPFIGLDFLIGVVLNVYLIYLIKDEGLKVIIASIVAALYGGFITLIGVAWTINKNEKDRLEEIKLRIKPLVFIVDSSTYNVSKFRILPISYTQDEVLNIYDTTYSINTFYVKNSEYSYSSIAGFVVDDKILFTFYKQILNKNEGCAVISDLCSFRYKNSFSRFGLLLMDMEGNYYVSNLHVKLEQLANNNEKNIIINSLYEIVPIQIDSEKEIVIDNN